MNILLKSSIKKYSAVCIALMLFFQCAAYPAVMLAPAGFSLHSGGNSNSGSGGSLIGVEDFLPDFRDKNFLDAKISNLNGLIDEALKAGGIRPAQHQILMYARKMLLNTSLPAHKKYKNYTDAVFMFTCAIHSQAWLSPTKNNSPINLRSIMQYYDFDNYERSHVNSVDLEKFLHNEVGDYPHFFIRDRVSALDLMWKAVHRYMEENDVNRNALVSTNIDFDFEGLNTDTSEIWIKRSKDNLKFEEECLGFDPSVIFMEISSDKELSAFSKRITHLKSKPAIVVILASSKLKADVKLISELNKNNINLYILHEIGMKSEGVLPIGNITVLTLCNKDITELDDYLASSTSEGILPDSFTVWYYSFLFGAVKKFPIKSVEHGSTSVGFMEDINKDKIAVLNEEYRKARQVLESTSLPGSFRGVKNLMLAALSFYSELCGKEDIGSGEYNSLIYDYRIFLKLTSYLLWMDSYMKEYSGAKTATKLLIEAERSYNNAFREPGGQYYQTSLLCSSGVGALRVLSHFWRGDTRKPAIFKNMYFELGSVMENASVLPYYVGYFEHFETEDNFSKIASGLYKAILLEPVFNNQTTIDGNYPLITLDIQGLLGRLINLKYNEPFYFVIDVTMYGQMFDLAGYLNGAVLPENFHIMLLSSLQKHHQNGMELSPAGAITVISRDEQSNARIASQLALARSETGMDCSLYSLAAFNFMGFERDKLISRIQGVCESAGKIVTHLDNLIKDSGLQNVQMSYPALQEHPDHDTWKQNNYPPPPVMYLNIANIGFVKFVEILARELKFYGIAFAARDSFGFDVLTVSNVYDRGLRGSIRLSFGIHSDQECRHIAEALFKTIFHGYTEIDDGNAVIRMLGSSL